MVAILCWCPLPFVKIPEEPAGWAKLGTSALDFIWDADSFLMTALVWNSKLSLVSELQAINRMNCAKTEILAVNEKDSPYVEAYAALH